MNAQTALSEAVVTAPHELSSPFTDLVGTLSVVREKFESLAGSLEDTKQRLRGRGTLPDHALVFEIGESHRAFTRLRAELIRRAQAQGLEIPPLDRILDLTDLTRLLEHLDKKAVSPLQESREPAPHVVETEPSSPPAFERYESETTEVMPESFAPDGVHIPEPISEEPLFVAIEDAHDPEPVSTSAAEEVVSDTTESEPISPALAEHFEHDSSERTRASAFKVLKEVVGLQLKEPGEFEPLASCQSVARDLLETISKAGQQDLPPEAQQLADGEHPFSSLLLVVEGVGDLTDAQWANHHAAISETFGRSMAVAAARGRILKPD